MSRLCKIGNTMNIKNYYGNLCTEMYEILHDKAAHPINSGERKYYA